MDDGDSVVRHVAGVTKLAAHGKTAQDRVDGGLVVKGNGSGLEVFNELADTEDLSRQTELLLDGFEGCDRGLGAVGTEQVPGVEAGEVLEGSQQLVATNYYRSSVNSSLHVPSDVDGREDPALRPSHLPLHPAF